jgi:acetyl esterase/lipase
MRGIRIVLPAIPIVMLAGATVTLGQAPASETTVRRDLLYATHDGVTLSGDFYSPKGADKHPVVVAVHGGAWQGGSRNGYRNWGPYLADRGIALYSIDYRLSKPGYASYPQAVHDVVAAIRFVKHNAADLNVDHERVALMGDSAGGHLVALVGLAGATPLFSKGYPNDPYAAVSPGVRAVVGVYGIYDLLQQWSHDQIHRPRDQIAEKFVGKPPMDDRKLYFDASPISYAVRAPNQPAFLLTWGTADDVVDPATQSEPFLIALKQADIQARTAIIPGAPHFWVGEPLNDPRSWVSAVSGQIVRFLEARFAATN